MVTTEIKKGWCVLLRKWMLRCDEGTKKKIHSSIKIIYSLKINRESWWKNVTLIMNNAWGHKEIIKKDKRGKAKEWWIQGTQGKLKRTKRDREKKDRVSQRVRDKTRSIYRTEKESIGWVWDIGEEKFNCDSVSHAHGPKELNTVTCNAGTYSFPAFTFIWLFFI